jgi:hypothetical protein
MKNQFLLVLTSGWISVETRNSWELASTEFVHYQALHSLTSKYSKVVYFPAGRVQNQNYEVVTQSIISDLSLIHDRLLADNGKLIMFSTYGLDLLDGNALTPYHIGKAAQEKYVSENYNPNRYLVLRLPNFFGINQPPGFLIPDLFSRSEFCQISESPADVDTVLAFLWIQDFILSLAEIVRAGSVGGIQYLGPEEFFSVSQLKRLFREKFKPSPIRKNGFKAELLRKSLGKEPINIADYMTKRIWGDV